MLDVITHTQIEKVQISSSIGQLFRMQTTAVSLSTG